jgi:hypothetical protein
MRSTGGRFPHSGGPWDRNRFGAQRFPAAFFGVQGCGIPKTKESGRKALHSTWSRADHSHLDKAKPLPTLAPGFHRERKCSCCIAVRDLPFTKPRLAFLESKP